MRRLIVVLSLMASALLGSPLSASAAAPPTPAVTWGSVLVTATPPAGGMVWDGERLWANTGTTVTEIWANSYSNGSAKNRTIDLTPSGFDAAFAPSTMVMVDSVLYMSGLANGHAAMAAIDPFGSPPHVLGVYDLQALGGAGVGALMLQGGVTAGSSILMTSSAGKIWRFTPSTSTMVELTGASGFPTSLALVGDRLWVGYATGSSSIDAYTYDAGSTSLGAPVVSITAPATSVQALSADSTYLWALQSGTVTKVSLASGAVLASGIAAGTAPSGIASDGTWVWVADPSSSPGRLIGINVADPSASTTISLVPPPPTGGGAISGVYFDGKDLWSSEFTDSTVEQLKLYPGAPTITSLTETGPGAAQLTYSPPSGTGNQSHLDYTLQIEGPNRSNIQVTELRQSGTDISGLEPGGHYCFSIQASNGPYEATSAKSCITMSAAATTTTPGGGLAATGSRVDLIAWLGLALLAVGGVLITRRRRVV